MSKKVSKQGNEEHSMNFAVIHPNSGAIDIGSMNMMVSYIGADGQYKVIETGAYTDNLHDLGKELRNAGVINIAMEATGVYWMAIYNILESYGIKVVLVNAQHFKNVAGQKTDVKDCQWLHQLHTFGLLRASHIAEEEYRELRAYIHERTILQNQKKDTLNRIQRVLELMNLKVQHLISDLEGVAGMQILRALAEGVNDPLILLDQVKLKSLKASKEDLIKSLTGNMQPYLVTILKSHLINYDFYKNRMLVYEGYIEAVLARIVSMQNAGLTVSVSKKNVKARKNQYSFNLKEYLIKLTGVDLTDIDGMDEKSILDIISVTGIDMNKWPTSGHFTSWLKLNSEPKISGGKYLGNQKRFSSNLATHTFRICAQTMWQSKSRLGMLYRKWSATKGSRKAIKAIARRLAVIFYNMVKRKEAYDPQKVALDEKEIIKKKVNRLKKEAEKLGLVVQAMA